jgi:NADH-quinone oxidoreductase subunit H
MDIITLIIVAIVKIAIFIGVLMTADAYMVLFERKVVGRMQNRWGPTRVGPFGLLQPMADGLKFIFKEDVTPPYVNRPLYILAPIISLSLALTSIAIIPVGNVVSFSAFGHHIETPLQVTGLVQNGRAGDINIGLLIILGITSIGVYGIALAGWASNNKYSLLGALRASAQMVSYEVALGLSLIGVLILSGTFSLRGIVEAQSGGFWHWNIFGGGQIVAFFIYLCAAFAETNRVPFDLPEAETELVAGYHTEYSAMKFAMFFVAEYTNMFTVACLASLLFLGGWSGPLFGPPILQAILPVIWFALRIVFFMFVYVWIRGTLPRFRYDQLMDFSWKFLFPLALANTVVTALIVALKS